MLFLGALVIFDIGSSLLGIFQVDKLRGHYKGIQGRGGSVVGISDLGCDPSVPFDQVIA